MKLVPTAVVLFLLAAAAAQTSSAPAAPLTADQDHRRMLDLLHIDSLRRGADGNNPNSPNAANRDESKAGPFVPLPDPLLLKNGKRVKSAKDWWNKRRPEIVEDFERDLYGRVPKNVPRVRWGVTNVRHETVGDVAVITKDLVGYVDNSADPAITVGIQLTLTAPADAKHVPVVMEFGFSPEFLAAITRRTQQSGQPNAFEAAALDWHKQVLAKGWAYANLVATSIQADNGAGLAQGVIGLTNKGQPRSLDDWGALRAWAWGASRALDYFETDPAVDAKRVVIEGLSRYGKAALVTMAFDQRFAIAFVGSSGAGGAKLWRRDYGEKLENLAGAGEYHWMDGNFLKYAGPLTPNDLPVDQHELIALCAPRPVFISSGSQDKGDSWVDPKGMFLATVGAGPVYRLLGKKDLGTSEMPPVDTGLTDGDLAFRQHSAGHTVGPNWPTFLNWAARYFSSK